MGTCTWPPLTASWGSRCLPRQRHRRSILQQDVVAGCREANIVVDSRKSSNEFFCKWSEAAGCSFVFLFSGWADAFPTARDVCANRRHGCDWYRPVGCTRYTRLLSNDPWYEQSTSVFLRFLVFAFLLGFKHIFHRSVASNISHELIGQRSQTRATFRLWIATPKRDYTDKSLPPSLSNTSYSAALLLCCRIIADMF